MEMDSKQLFHQLMQSVTLSESREEKESILFWAIEHTLGLSKTDVLAGKKVIADLSALDQLIQRINQQEPLQYILGEAQFYGRKFFVNSSVLIPRPETEMLVREAAEFSRSNNKSAFLLDIGTGSGCIAITLALECSPCAVIATDISKAALTVAKKNAEQLHASVNFVNHDILNDELQMGPFDVVASNPPYIPFKEKIALQKNVREHEPGIALFVSDSNPLLYHQTIAKKSRRVLKSGGLLITEIHENLGPETADVFRSNGFNQVKIIRDLSGKNRFVTGIAVNG